MMNSNMPVSASTLRPSMDLIKESWSRFAKRWKFFLMYMVLSMVVPGAIVLIGVFLGSIIGVGGAVLGGEQAGMGLLIGAGLALLALAVVVIYISILFSVGMMLAIMDENLNNVRGALKQAKPKAFDILIIGLISAVLIALASLLLVLPGIYFGVCYTFASWVYLTEGKTGMDALRRSKELVSGRWWAVFGRLVVMLLVVWAVSLLPQVLLSSMGFEGLSALYNFLASIVVGVPTTIFVYLLYKNLVATKPPTVSSVS